MPFCIPAKSDEFQPLYLAGIKEHPPFRWVLFALASRRNMQKTILTEASMEVAGTSSRIPLFDTVSPNMVTSYERVCERNSP